VSVDGMMRSDTKIDGNVEKREDKFRENFIIILKSGRKRLDHVI
jgi:hypothetical protein